MNNRVLQGLFLLGSISLIGCSSTDDVSSIGDEPSFTKQSSAKSEAEQPVPSKTVDAQTIAQWVDSSILAPEGLSLQNDNIQYLTGSADLNSDGKSEYIVLVQDRYFCGSGGCTAYMLNDGGKVINRMTVTRTPIVLADSYSNGWQDFIVWSNGAYRLMSYNGQAYPSNPSLEPKIDRDAGMQTAIANVMASELYQQDGYDIMPGEAQQLWTPANVYHLTFKHYGDPHRLYQATVDINTGEVDIESVPMAQ